MRLCKVCNFFYLLLDFTSFSTSFCSQITGTYYSTCRHNTWRLNKKATYSLLSLSFCHYYLLYTLEPHVRPFDRSFWTQKPFALSFSIAIYIIPLDITHSFVYRLLIRYLSLFHFYFFFCSLSLVISEITLACRTYEKSRNDQKIDRKKNGNLSMANNGLLIKKHVCVESALVLLVTFKFGIKWISFFTYMVRRDLTVVLSKLVLQSLIFFNLRFLWF